MRIGVVNCQHATPSPCAAGHYGGSPSPGVCEVCPHRVARHNGPAVEWSEGEAIIQPVPRDQWPAWAAWVAKHRATGDIGVGTTIERELGIAGRVFKAAFAAFGIDCGCADRRRRFDQQYPYTDHQP